jgi:hypothetical protein
MVESFERGKYRLLHLDIELLLMEQFRNTSLFSIILSNCSPSIPYLEIAVRLSPKNIMEIANKRE